MRRAARRCRSSRSCAGPACSPSRRSTRRRSRRSALTLVAAGACASSRRRARAKARSSRAMLEERCRGIEAQIARVAPRIPAIHAAYVEKLGARLQRGRPRSRRRAAEAGARAVRDQDRRRRGSVAARRRTSPRCGACSRAGGSAGKRLDFLMQELQSRGEHAGLEVGRRRAVAGGARAQGADRADARAGAEHRMSAAIRRGRPATRRRRSRDRRVPVGNACSSSPRRPAAARPASTRALLEREPGIQLSVSYTTRPPRPGEQRRRRTTTSSTSRTLHGAQGRRRVSRARARARQLVRDLGDLAQRDRSTPGSDVLLEIDWQGAPQVRRLVPDSVHDLHPAAVARSSLRERLRQARPGRRTR